MEYACLIPLSHELSALRQGVLDRPPDSYQHIIYILELPPVILVFFKVKDILLTGEQNFYHISLNIFPLPQSFHFWKKKETPVLRELAINVFLACPGQH